MATGDFKEISEISGDFSRYFVQESDEQLQRTLGTEVFQGEFTIDENLTAFDTSPIFQRTDTPNEYKPEPPEPATTVKRISGANWYVYNGLKNITFVPGTACQMSQVIAYIRYWSRGGTADKTPVETEEQSTVPTDPQEKMSDELNNNYYKSAEAFDDTPQPAETKTVLTVPDNSAYQSRPRQPIPVQVPDTKTQPSPKAGKVFSANPSGVTSVREVIEAPNPTDAVWVFLFNPEELQLSSGPDYNRAETWGVSDPKNSGQPLSWRSNRNRKLSFGKVLLHGYTFGKRVDSLESGLQQLFMARDGENGSDGPPVLEFVWGKRIFGPCVIQNIQVKEKAWDKGILVNAEVSFELEQVPEWTINDGYVDILRPGRQPLVNDPLLPRGDYSQPREVDAENDKPANKPGGGNPKPPTTGNPDLCNQFLVSSGQFQKVFEDSNIELRSLYTGKETAQRLGTAYDNALIDMEKKNPLLDKTVKKDVDAVAPRCLDRGSWGSFTPTDPRRTVAFINGCAKRVKTSLDDWLKRESAKTCLSLRKTREAVEKEAENKAKEAEEKKKCEPYRRREAFCTNTQLGSRLTCGGVQYYCFRRPDGYFSWIPGA